MSANPMLARSKASPFADIPRRTTALWVGMRSFAVAALVFLGGVAALSCQDVPAPPPDDQVIKALGAFVPAPPPPPVEGLDIYIDGSQSMQGFTAAKDSNFCALIKEILLEAQTAGFQLTTYSFSTRITPLANPSLASLQSAQFYTGLDTPLDKLLEFIEKQPNRSALVITDLVQSDHGRDYQAVLRELSAIGGSRQMDLLAYRSSFSGRYKPEYSQGSRPVIALNLSDKIPGQGRPLYLLVIAPNERSLTQLRQHLLRDVPAASPSQEFNAAAAPFRIANVKLNQAAAGGSWQTYTDHSAAPYAAYRMRFVWVGTDASSRTLNLPLAVHIEANTPIRQMESLDLEATRSAHWTGRTFAGVSGTKRIPVSEEGRANPPERPVSLTLDLPDKGSWNAYRIEVNPGEANLEPPAWVSQWSTDDDSNAAQGNRTFQLDWLVRAMVNSVSEHKSCCEWILEIGRGA